MLYYTKIGSHKKIYARDIKTFHDFSKAFKDFKENHHKKTVKNLFKKNRRQVNLKIILIYEFPQISLILSSFLND